MKKILPKIALTSALLASTATFTILSGNHKIVVPAYTAVEIVDGDTFKTNEKQTIRLNEIDAPEIDHCNGKEARQYLTQILKDKPLYLKIVYRDPHNRLISNVYSPDGNISEIMVEQGMARYTSKQGTNKKLKTLSDKAKTNKTGIYNNICTQTENTQNPICNIKGNINTDTNIKYYRSANCGLYNSTIVQLYLGDQWFCTEKEAIKAGFTKGSDCPK